MENGKRYELEENGNASLPNIAHCQPFKYCGSRTPLEPYFIRGASCFYLISFEFSADYCFLYELNRSPSNRLYFGFSVFCFFFFFRNVHQESVFTASLTTTMDAKPRHCQRSVRRSKSESRITYMYIGIHVYKRVTVEPYIETRSIDVVLLRDLFCPFSSFISRRHGSFSSLPLNFSFVLYRFWHLPVSAIHVYNVCCSFLLIFRRVRPALVFFFVFMFVFVFIRLISWRDRDSIVVPLAPLSSRLDL